MSGAVLTIGNIDLEAGLFDRLALQIREEIGVDPGIRILLLHRRKPEPVSHGQRNAVLAAVKGLAQDLGHDRSEADALFVLDCGPAEEGCVHSDLSLLADIMQELAKGLEVDLNADVVLIDYVMQGDEGSSALGDIDVRSLRDPSVLEDRTAQALAGLDPNVDLDALAFSEQEIYALVDDVMSRLKDDQIGI